MLTAQLQHSGPPGAEPPPLPLLRHKTLSAYYPRLCTLRSYLDKAGGANSSPSTVELTRDTDPDDYTRLLDQTVCAMRDGAPPCPPMEPVKRGVGLSHAEVLDRVCADLWRKGGGQEQALLLGLKVSSAMGLS